MGFVKKESKMPNLANRPNMSKARSGRNTPRMRRSKFRCPHCPFTGCNMQTLRNHALHHSTRFSLACPFCNFSVSHKNAMARHINRVHSKKAAKHAKQNKMAEKSSKTADAALKKAENESPPMERGFHNVEKDRKCDEEEVIVIVQDETDDPGKQMTKLIKAITSFSQIYKDNGQISDNVLGVDPNLESNEKKEEIQCHKELDQMVKDIRSCRFKIAQAFKEKEEETRLNMAEQHLRQRMEILKVTEQGLSVQLSVLMEQKRRIQEKAAVKTELKMKTDREIFLLKFSSCSKVKQNNSGSSPYLEKNKEMIQKIKETLVDVLKKKLDEIGKEENRLNERIQTTERKLEENSKNLAEIRKDLESLRTLPASASSSSITVRINTLKSELRERVDRFAYLEEQLISLNFKYITDDIRKKKKEWLDSYGCDEA